MSTRKPPLDRVQGPGQLIVAVTPEQTHVVVQFQDPDWWVHFTPAEARGVAELLVAKAAEIEREQREAARRATAPPATCSWEGCARRPTHEVSVKLYCRERAGWHVEALARLFVCAEHGPKVTVDHVMTEADWQAAAKEAAYHGQPAPTPALAKLKLRPIAP
jgi:hypothetical protein